MGIEIKKKDFEDLLDQLEGDFVIMKDHLPSIFYNHLKSTIESYKMLYEPEIKLLIEDMETIEKQVSEIERKLDHLKNKHGLSFEGE